MLGWLFGRREKISSLEALGTFCDRQAAFNCQKNIYEFIRARASTHSDTLFEEADFKSALERARWQGYPIALNNILEMVAAILRKAAGADEVAERQILQVIQGIARRLMDGYRQMQPFPEEEWEGMTRRLLASLAHAAAMPLKPVKDIPVARSKAFFDLIPLHPDIKAPDFKSIENHMRVNLCRAHDELLRRAEPAALQALVAREATIALSPGVVPA